MLLLSGEIFLNGGGLKGIRVFVLLLLFALRFQFAGDGFLFLGQFPRLLPGIAQLVGKLVGGSLPEILGQFFKLLFCSRPGIGGLIKLLVLQGFGGLLRFVAGLVQLLSGLGGAIAIGLVLHPFVHFIEVLHQLPLFFFEALQFAADFLFLLLGLGLLKHGLKLLDLLGDAALTPSQFLQAIEDLQVFASFLLLRLTLLFLLCLTLSFIALFFLLELHVHHLALTSLGGTARAGALLLLGLLHFKLAGSHSEEGGVGGLFMAESVVELPRVRFGFDLSQGRGRGFHCFDGLTKALGSRFVSHRLSGGARRFDHRVLSGLDHRSIIQELGRLGLCQTLQLPGRVEDFLLLLDQFLALVALLSLLALLRLLLLLLLLAVLAGHSFAEDFFEVADLGKAQVAGDPAGLSLAVHILGPEKVNEEVVGLCSQFFEVEDSGNKVLLAGFELIGGKVDLAILASETEGHPRGGDLHVVQDVGFHRDLLKRADFGVATRKGELDLGRIVALDLDVEEGRSPILPPLRVFEVNAQLARFAGCKLQGGRGFTIGIGSEHAHNLGFLIEELSACNGLIGADRETQGGAVENGHPFGVHDGFGG